MQQPIGVSTYQLPQHLQDSLPTIEQLEAELEIASESYPSLDLELKEGTR